jgi:dephospho-CoA kinase
MPVVKPVKPSEDPFRIAITGGIGSGKSTALQMFAARGAAVLDADEVVHSLLQQPALREEIAVALGISPFEAGQEGRRELAEVVFAEGPGLERLQGIIFPLVRRYVEAWFADERVRAAGLAVVELPMLHEAGMEGLFDRIVLITAPPELRKSRQAREISGEQFDRRSSRQLPEEDKRSRSHLVYENTGSTEELDEFVASVVAAVTPDRSDDSR